MFIAISGRKSTCTVTLLLFVVCSNASAQEIELERRKRDSLYFAGETLLSSQIGEQIIANEVWQKSQTPLARGKDYEMLTRALEDGGETKKGIQYCYEGLALLEASQNDTSYAYEDLTMTLGYLYGQIPIPDSTFYYKKKCLALHEKYRYYDQFRTVSIRAELALHYIDQGKLALAEQYYEDLFSLYDSGKFKKGGSFANMMMNYANHWYEMEDFGRAEDALQEALKATIDQKNVTQHNVIKDILASVVYQRGDIQRADLLLRQSLPVLEAKSGVNNQWYQYGQTTLAGIYADLGIFDEANSICDRMLKIMENNSNTTSYNYIFFQRTKGFCQIQKGNIEEGLAWMKQAAENAMQHLDPADINLYFALNAYTVELAQLKRVEDAKKYADLATAYANSAHVPLNSESTYLDQQYHLSLMNDDYASAIVLLKQQLEINDRPSGLYHDKTLIRLAGLYYLAGDTKNCFNTLSTYAQSNIETLSEHLLMLTETQRLQYLNVNQDYASLLFSVAEQNPTLYKDLIWQHINTNKSLLMRSHNELVKAAKNTNDPAVLKLYQHWNNNRNLLSRVESYGATAIEMGYDKKQIEKETDSLQHAMEKAIPGIKSLMRIAMIDQTELLAKIKENEAIIDITRYKAYRSEGNGSIKYVAQILKKGPNGEADFSSVFFANGNEMESFLIEWQHNSVSGSQNKPLPSGIYDAFWSPIAPYLQGITKVYWVPDGVFHNLALEALPLQNSSQMLIDGLVIVHLFNVNDIMSPTQSPNTFADAKLFANPRFEAGVTPEPTEDDGTYKSRSVTVSQMGSNPPSLSPLPGSEEEVKRLGNLLGRNSCVSTTYTDTLAREEQLQAFPSGQILHIATHGYFLNKEFDYQTNPMLRSMLFFTGASNTLRGESTLDLNDGILTAYEASTLPLDNTYLATMSACHTGAAQWLPGEGSFGLPRALHMAGAKFTLVSLWEVEDKADQELLLLFYGNMLAGIEIHEALRRAKLQHRVNYPAPKYWAGWVLTGY